MTMGNRDDGNAHLVVDASKEFDDPAFVAKIKVAGRLVCQENGGVIDKGTCYGDALLLTPADSRDALPQQRLWQIEDL